MAVIKQRIVPHLWYDKEAKEAAEFVFANVYHQWGEIEYRKVMDIIASIFI